MMKGTIYKEAMKTGKKKENNKAHGWENELEQKKTERTFTTETQRHRVKRN